MPVTAFGSGLTFLSREFREPFQNRRQSGSATQRDDVLTRRRVSRADTEWTCVALSRGRPVRKALGDGYAIGPKIATACPRL